MKPALLYPMNVICELLTRAKALGLSPKLTIDKDFDWHLAIEHEASPGNVRELLLFFDFQVIKSTRRVWEPRHFDCEGRRISLPSSQLRTHAHNGATPRVDTLWALALEHLQLSETVP